MILMKFLSFLIFCSHVQDIDHRMSSSFYYFSSGRYGVQRPPSMAIAAQKFQRALNAINIAWSLNSAEKEQPFDVFQEQKIILRWHRYSGAECKLSTYILEHIQLSSTLGSNVINRTEELKLIFNWRFVRKWN